MNVIHYVNNLVHIMPPSLLHSVKLAPHTNTVINLRQLLYPALLDVTLQLSLPSLPLHCALSLAAQCIVIGPVCGCVCV